MSIGGFATQPSFKNPGYIPNNDGQAVIYPGMFGVVNNIKVGDNAFGWAGDHIEPGVSIDSENPHEHFALHYLVCTGNKAIVRSGEAKGSIGIVTGEHARNLIHFESKTLDKICIGDQIDIITHGRGLKLLDFPNIEIKKIDTKLLKSMLLRVIKKKLIVDVAIELPIRIMGSGAELNSEYVDQDLMSGDRDLMKKLKIDQMKLGDLIAINHADHRWGRSYKKNYVSISNINTKTKIKFVSVYLHIYFSSIYLFRKRYFIPIKYRFSHIQLDLPLASQRSSQNSVFSF